MKVCETFCAYSYGAQVEPFKQKKMVENFVTLSLKGTVSRELFSNGDCGVID